VAASAPGEVMRTEFATHDPAELREVIDQGFGSRLQLAVPRRRDWRATLTHVDAGSFTSTETRLPADLTFINDGHDQSFVIDTLLEGGISIERGQTISRYQAGDSFLGTGPGVRHTVRSNDASVRAIALPRSLLTSVAAEASGRPQPGWTFSSPEPVSGGARQWRNTAQYVDSLLADSEAIAAPLLIGPVARLLAATALTVFPNTAISGPADDRQGLAATATVRRAIAFIDEHAQQDITLADIAAAALVSPRALQLAFRRYLDTTPMAYLRRVRLDHAHQDLMAADPARQTVTAIAYRWGFPSPTRFVAYYRRAYGVAPSRTLNRG
jgi:AraC-like DNA-binding protein